MIRNSLLILWVASLPLYADDWPQWRGPARTGHVPAGGVVPDKLPDAPRSIWRKPVGYGLASPIVAGGKVYHLDHQDNKEVLHALSLETGQELWSAPIDQSFKDTQSAAGPRCTPVADGDRIYAQSCRGQLICFAAADGKVVWQTNFVKDFGAVFIGETGKAEGATRHGNDGSPIIDGDHLVAQVGSNKGASLVCFEKRTGKVVWKSQDDTAGYASPIIADIAGVRQVVSFTAQAVIAADVRDGTLLWRIPVKTSLGRHVTTPVVVGDLVLVSSHQAGLIGIKVARQGEGLKAEPAWTRKESAINFASPVAVGGHLYAVGPRKNLICVEADSGKQTWSQDGLFAGTGGSAYAGMLVMGKNLLILTDRGEVILAAADPTAFREISRAQVCGKNWCVPAYADGLLIGRDERELWCVQLAARASRP